MRSRPLWGLAREIWGSADFAGISDLRTVVDTIPVSTVRTLAGASHRLVRLTADITKIDTFWCRRANCKKGKPTAGRDYRAGEFNRPGGRV